MKGKSAADFLKKHQGAVMNALLVLSFLQQRRWLKLSLCVIGCAFAVFLWRRAEPDESKLAVVIVFAYFAYVIVGNIVFLLLKGV